MCQVLQKCAGQENIVLPNYLAERISTSSEGNMRKAILMMEAMYVQQYPFQESQPLPTTDWELFIASIATIILNDQTPASLLEVRGKLYQLLANCIPPDVIIKVL
jgi:replication factor C subunit 3/5